MKDEKFREDLDSLLAKLSINVSSDVQSKLSALKSRLLDLHEENLVKINHSVMELVAAKHLLMKDFSVQIEYVLAQDLTCDLYGVKGYGRAIVEIETGFIPPDHALDPKTYLFARIASKIIRYSSHAEKFVLGIPPHYVLSFPKPLTVPARDRTSEDLKTVKSLCDLYYHNPPVTLDEVRNATVHSIYIVDVDRAVVEEIDPEKYIKNCPLLNAINHSAWSHGF